MKLCHGVHTHSVNAPKSINFGNKEMSIGLGCVDVEFSTYHVIPIQYMFTARNYTVLTTNILVIVLELRHIARICGCMWPDISLS